MLLNLIYQEKFKHRELFQILSKAFFDIAVTRTKEALVLFADTDYDLSSLSGDFDSSKSKIDDVKHYIIM